MSNNLVSEPFLIPTKQMDPISDKLEVSVPSIQMGIMGGMSNSPTTKQFEISNKQMGLVEALPSNFGSYNSPELSRQMVQPDLQGTNLGFEQFIMANQHVGDMEAMFNNLGSQKMLPSKRSATGEPIFSNFVGQQLLMPNKNVTQMEAITSNAGLQQLSSPNRRTTQMHFKSGTPSSQNLPTANKKMVRNESISGRSGTKQLQTPKNRTVQMESSPKVQTESFESVRLKMRESLASALALVTQHQDKASNEESNSQNEVAKSPQQMQQDSQQTQSTSALADVADYASDSPIGSQRSKESSSLVKANEGPITSLGNFANDSMGDSVQSWKSDGQEGQCTNVLPSEDVSFGDSFFVKDELLQGNGLCWALDADVAGGEPREVQIAKKARLVDEDMGGQGSEQAVRSPQDLAFKIEAELFKLFGGVNKKYKEKGRSLLFNLKDRNNPELRERVLSGDIPPDRLCSMTAEELASKELSQWRIAKAEELAQMVVLPDSDVDIRRLVKKTHKGEFQVEVEQDDSVSVEVSVGTSSLTRAQSKNKDTEAHSVKADEAKNKENVAGEKSTSEIQDHSCSLTIPNDGTDLMQGLMGDEFKDAEFLPPIVSLDEFMESLDSEPPFENLPVDSGKRISPSDKENSKGCNDGSLPDIASKRPVDATAEKSDKANVKYTDSDVKTTKLGGSPVKAEPTPGAASKGDHVWEGVLQLNVSALVTVSGFFRSGEKTSAKEWPVSLEIKGRVRLDAFEKFIQELPMSRSRAVMVAQFVLKEGSSENDRASLGEVVDSYVLDERLGFAEPAPGVEIYFCPPHERIVEMLSKHLPKDHTEILSSIDSGLIGIVVWRKAHLSSAISPNSSSHHKHSKKHHFTSRRQQEIEKDVNMNANFVSKPILTALNPPMNDDDDDDDIPPGFGPGAAARDEDDLPEFNFSGGAPPNLSYTKPPNRIQYRSAAPSRPVDQVRQLIQKYGQTVNVGMGIQPWNEAEDDDIPEWQPQQPTPPPPGPNFQHPRALNHHHLQPRLQPLVNMVQPGLQNVGPAWQQGGGWVQPPGPRGYTQSGAAASGGGGGRYHGLRAGQTPMDWRRDPAPRSGRGF